MKKRKINFFNIIWIFIIGSFLGYIGECTFYILKYHNFVNKQGLIIGPFKPMYGFALIIATYILKLLKADTKLKQFFYSVILGIIFEYFVSFILEKIWNIYIWDYSSFNFNINGRVYLSYSIIWGLIGLIYYSYLLPLILKICDKLNGKIYKIISTIATVFIIIDCILTIGIFFRIRDYNKNNFIYNTLDYLFPKEVINERFSKVRIKDNKIN